ncbi:hypothetical protein HDU99_003275 [Rhizoclosmatium hyalinum]|nr:hypothetical protein HDU99_003275 [Rhizoclosmatium hyalinum]
MFHLERLENLLKGLEGDGEGVARFVGRGYEEPVMHMTGMLYLLSANFVEWINASPVPRKLIHGIEDVMVGKWIQEGNLAIDFVEQGARFHDLPESDAFSRGEVTRETVVLHWCKDANRMYRCMTELFGNQMAEGQSAKRLTTPQALENRRNGFNLTETTGWIDTITKIEYVVESTPGKANLTQIDALIFRPHVIAQIDKLGLLEDLQPEEIDNIIHRVSLHGYHATTKTPIDAISIRRYVLFYLIKYRFPEEKRWNRKPVIYESAERLLKASEDRVIKLDEIDALWKRLLDEDEKKREEEKLKAALKTQGLEKEKTKKVDKKN